MTNENTVSRRYFIKVSLATSGGLMLAGFLKQSDAFAQEGRTAAGQFVQPPGGRSAAGDDFAINAWLRISPADEVTLISSQSEMGQGVMTTLPAVLAEELGADWSRVKIEMSSTAPAYQNPRLKWQFTGNSESSSSFFDLLRNMGASAREMLIAAAAAKWGVEASACEAEDGKVFHRPTKRSFTFGALAESAARQTPPEKPRLRAEKDWRLLGKALPRVEVPLKLNGTAIFGMDFSVPGMVHAAVKQAPVHGGTVAAFDKASVMELPGVIDVVPVPNGIAVVAGQYYQALNALKALKITYDDGANAGIDTESLNQQYHDALEGTKWKTAQGEETLDGAALKQKYDNTLEQEYESQFLAHATMEPMNCTAHVTDEKCEIWGPTQGNQLTQYTLAQILKMPPEKVSVTRTLLGGGFGRRLWTDFAVQAALASKAVGRPVKVIWTREEDMRHDIYRPATLNRITAAVGKDGQPVAVAHKVVSPSILQFIFQPGMTEDLDPSCLEGLLEEHTATSIPSGEPTTLYRIPTQRIDFHLLKVGVPTSVLRTTGFGPNIFAWESFVDELAHQAKQDPFLYRRNLIANKRLLAVLELAAEKAGWKTRPSEGFHRGIACTEAFNTHIAHVVELSVKGNLVKISKIVCAIDPGTVLDPEISKNSLEGGTVWGLGCAFMSNISFKDGQTVEGNFNSFQIPRMHEVPPIEVYMINSGARPLGGTGEVGPVTLIPAVANAIFAATGKRYRSLPLSRHGLQLV